MQNEKKQFIYVLKLIPSLLNTANWTKREEEIVGRHFAKLQELLEEGKLVMAGKTLGIDENTFGIVILEVESEEAAVMIMKNDPAVSEGIMTAELFPYKIALIKSQNE